MTAILSKGSTRRSVDKREQFLIRSSVDGGSALISVQFRSR